MHIEVLSRLLELSQKTGDRLVVVEGDTAVVLLPLERYEELLKRMPADPAPASFTPASEPLQAPHANFLEQSASSFPQKSHLPWNPEEPISPLFDHLEEETGEEQFYLEPVE